MISKPVFLACGSAPYRLGAVLSHIMLAGSELPISFVSRTSKSEGNYSQIEECLDVEFLQSESFTNMFMIDISQYKLTINL